ncbi:hypothetical protein [Paenibacillus wynnii]|uniref:hypothetical protein n=1 Tax=Paenibacillus wynnii TaxID=268407 RepID=UPI002791C70D|nr:hypothetical protein [Paenibacillus wynnii]MDQ0192525.1 hypothetical protein [Paenibacillus wynnii]
MKPAYEAPLTLTVKSGLVTEIVIDEPFSFSSLEYEELKEDAELLIEKMKRRKERWTKKQNALSNLIEKKLED